MGPDRNKMCGPGPLWNGPLWDVWSRTAVEVWSWTAEDCVVTDRSGKRGHRPQLHTCLYVHDLKTGALLYPIPLPIGSVSGFYGRKRKTEVFFSFESFFAPAVIYHVDFAKVGDKLDWTRDVHEVRRVRISGVDTDAMDVKQIFYASKDGTKVPMYVLHRKDIALDGNNPTILNGYGGFNVADMPYFSVSRLLFIQHLGGIVACANLRGGSEYGEKWHEAGMRERKQNVFDDFIAAAEHLIAHKYTQPSRLGIQGGSNGGLLMAAVSQQRPDLFGAVLNRVGVMDMLRFHKFTIGAAWLPEYGNPDDAKDFPFIYKYSPLHNIRVTSGVQWPATMMMTADHDDRVVPSHTLKYVAQLYHTLATKARDTQRKPVIARIEVKAGHGAGKPTSKIIAELVDLYCFLQRVLRIEWRD
ncbi:prolyl oligopeptidase family protein [Aphelenchoides avenae]|nr:prolyl oligopeptidase family protein [Aphelenchus avenae]